MSKHKQQGIIRRWALKVSSLKGAVVAASWLPAVALAQGLDGGLGKSNSYVQLIVTFFGSVGVGIFTIALMVAGYKFAFAQARFTDLIPILIGGLLFGSAGAIALYMVG